MSRTAVADPPRRRRSSSAARNPRAGAHDVRSAGTRGGASGRSAGVRSGANARSAGAHSSSGRSAVRSASARRARARRVTGGSSGGLHTGSAAIVAAPERRSDPRRDAQRPGRHLRPVPESSRRGRRISRAGRRRLAVAGAALLVVVAALGLVYLHVLGAERQFTLNSLQSQVTKAQQTYNDQRLQVAQLEAPGRIVSVAQGQLGMVPPPNVMYLNAPPPPPPSAVTPNSAPAQAQHNNDAPTAPAGDANWPQIKKLLKGTP